MKTFRVFPFIIAVLLVALSLSCQAASGFPFNRQTGTSGLSATATALPPIPVQPGADNPEEPVLITGDIPYTSPFFLNTISEPFVMLEDLAGFRMRDHDFEFPILGQAIGPVEIQEDGTVTYNLALPSIPQGTQLDLDNNGQEDTGVQVFAVAYWSNTWGGPFLEARDGGGWSNAYTSAISDPENNDEITGGMLIVWAPDDSQSFPTGFGEDGLLFTDDDPVAPIPAGYNIVDINLEPFTHYKKARTNIQLIEGDIAVNDLSGLSYEQAFESLFEKVSREYPFTEEKQIDWDILHEVHAAQIADARDEDDFYKALRDFANSIPDAHISISLRPDIFYTERGGGFGLVAIELSDGRVIITHVVRDSPADSADVEVGAEIISWNDQPVSEAISEVVPDFGPYSTDHHERLEQVTFLTRLPPGESVEIRYQNPGDQEPSLSTLESVPEYDSLFLSLPIFSEDELALPIEGEILDDSGLGYLRIRTFSEDYSLLATIWEYFMEQLISNETPGLIIDLRRNSGGSGRLALDFAGYFFEEEITLYDENYYSDNSGSFESDGNSAKITPGPEHYEGAIAVLVSPYCISACEGFAYAMAQQGRAVIIGHYPTAGAFGEVGRGQYDLPDDISMQFPTGRPLSPEEQVIIEGRGVVPDIIVPVTEDSALNLSDPVLQTAIDELVQ